MKIQLYEYHGIGGARFVPWLVTGVVIPIWLLNSYIKYGNGLEFGSQAMLIFCLLLPMFAPWWNIHILQQYVENEGNEIYFLYKKEKMHMVGKYFLLYCIPVALLYGISGLACHALWLELPGMLIACFFVNSFAYLFLMFIPSGMAAILICVLYPIYVIYFYNGGYRWFIYFYRQGVSEEIVWKGLIPMLIASICFTIIGYERNLRHRTYT